MNKEQIFGLVRTIVAALGGWAAGAGYLDGETATALGGAVATVVVAVWSFAEKRAAK